MNTNLSEIIFILDRSGSMSGLEQETIKGYNRFLNSQREIPGVAQVTTVLFDNQYELLHNGVNIRLVEPITCNEYFTRGSTALLDAVGKTILDVGNRLNQTPEEERPGKVIFIITTDGQENASQEFNWSTIRDMINRQRKKYSWEFIFLGANIDADETAEKLCISSNRTANFNADEDGLNTMYFCINSFVSDIRNDHAEIDLKDTMQDADLKKSRSKKLPKIKH
jgi:uncharacterized protein YegL